jgi:methylthioribose-1-phosphate isomerase
MLRTLEWTGSTLKLLDQTRLPNAVVDVELSTAIEVHDAIRRLVVRGAPAIGVSAAYGMLLGIRDARSLDELRVTLTETADLLGSARPTAVNLAWAIQRISLVAQTELRSAAATVRSVLERVEVECADMLRHDAEVCEAIGGHALPLLLAAGVRRGRDGRDNPIGILTHCNAGLLATCGIGTATAPIYLAHRRGIRLTVWADETRPLLQGARLTATELHQGGIDVRLICDDMAASVMSRGLVDAVIVGTDRVAANGDVANKIGTLGVAILARHFQIPFLVAAPTSSIDLACPSGRDIPIEQRAADEVTRFRSVPIAMDGIAVDNPAFDVTPYDLVTAIVTEHGVWTPPAE